MAWVSGIDWSGDPGDPAKPGASPLLVIAIASTTAEQLPVLAANLASIRSALRWSDRTPFHFIDSDNRSRSLFFENLDPSDLWVHVLIETKQAWYEPADGSRPLRPGLMLDRAIAAPVGQVPTTMTFGQTILIDRPRAETSAMRSTVEEIRAALRTRGNQRLPRVKPLPDHRADAELIQIADMFAGAIAAWGSEDRRLARFSGQLDVV